MSPPDAARPPANRRAQSKRLDSGKLDSRLHRRSDYLQHFARRVVADALNEATRAYWLRRAEQFEAAQHKPGDFVGLSSVEQIEAANAKLAEKATACRNHAQLVETFGVGDDDQHLVVDAVRHLVVSKRRHALKDDEVA